MENIQTLLFMCGGAVSLWLVKLCRFDCRVLVHPLYNYGTIGDIPPRENSITD